MSQNSSLTQSTRSVRQALTAYRLSVMHSFAFRNWASLNDAGPMDYVLTPELFDCQPFQSAPVSVNIW